MVHTTVPLPNTITEYRTVAEASVAFKGHQHEKRKYTKYPCMVNIFWGEILLDKPRETDDKAIPRLYKVRTALSFDKRSNSIGEVIFVLFISCFEGLIFHWSKVR
jgi:hypothetical protein